MNCLYKDDCFTVLPQLAESSVDMCLLDLPYGQINSAWDNKLDLGELWKNLERVCKPKANILFFCSTRFGFELIASKRDCFRYDLIWEKAQAVGFLNCNLQPLRKHECIYVFSKEPGVYNPQKTLIHKPRVTQKKNTATEIYTTPSQPTDDDGRRHPTSIIFCQRDNTSKRLHPTMKPLELCRLLVRQYSNEGDVVLDCCMGSGTSLVAAKLENRQYIGIELNEQYYKLADYRINHSETDPLALLLETEVHENTIDNPEPPIDSSIVVAEPIKKTRKRKIPVTEPTLETTTQIGEPIVVTGVRGGPGMYGEKGFKRIRRVKKTEPETPHCVGIYNEGVIHPAVYKRKKKNEIAPVPEVISFKNTRKKKIVVIDPAFNEVEMEVENLTIEDTSVPCEVVSDIDEIQMASLTIHC